MKSTRKKSCKKSQVRNRISGRCRNKSIKRKSKSIKRKSKSIKRKSKSIKRKSKSIKRKSKSIKRKSKSKKGYKLESSDFGMFTKDGSKEVRKIFNKIKKKLL
jgi:hypothetical protein